MKKFLLLILFLHVVHVKAQQLQWAHNVGSVHTSSITESGFTYGICVKNDNAGNVFLSGWFGGTTDFDPSSNVYNLTPQGDFDFFIAKYDANGAFLWAINVGGPHTEMVVNDITVDKNQNIIIAGSIYGPATGSVTIDFDPGANTQNITTAGTDNVFLAKYNKNGNYMYAFNLYGCRQATTVSTTSDNDVVLTGKIVQSTDFDPGVNNYYVSQSGCFISKYDSVGNFKWVNQFGNYYMNGMITATDKFDNIYAAGVYSDSLDLDPGPAIHAVSSLNKANLFMYIAKYNSSGNYIWARAISGKDTGSSASAYAIATDNNNNFYIGGPCGDSVDFSPNNYSSSYGSGGTYLAKYDSSGAFKWVFQLGDSTSVVNLHYIACNMKGKIDISGYCIGTIDFNPAPADTNKIYATTGFDYFLAQYDTAGNYNYVLDIKQCNDAGSVACDSSGNIWITGGLQSNSSDFDPSSATYNLTPLGTEDAFLAKYNFANIAAIPAYNTKNSAIQIYPNPAQNNFTVEVSTNEKQILNVYDINGKLVLSQTINGTTNIDACNFSAGVYNISIINSAGVTNRRLVIVK
ncbi:MAG TPA: T9SS type A sorting domain-containing protein [Bacteroidia bacterium]|nr:T9SS type A sorting domain-containing protein [Bacteroidia bacterium]